MNMSRHQKINTTSFYFKTSSNFTERLKFDDAKQPALQNINCVISSKATATVP